MNLQESVLSFSVYPAGGDPGSADVTDIVLVAPGTPIARGFERAQALAQDGRTVRLIGDGVTFAQNWPAWVRSAKAPVLTEIGAFLTGDLVAYTDEVRDGIIQWLRKIMGGKPLSISVDIFYGDALERQFFDHCFFAPALTNIVKFHGARRYHYVGVEGIALEGLRARAESAGGAVSAGPRRAQPFWRFKVAALGAATLFATFLYQFQRYLAERRSRARLRELRQLQKSLPPPRLWITMFPDWTRGNKHLIESIVAPALKRGDSLGVLLAGKLVPGLRHEINMRRHLGNDLWPALGPVLQALDRCVVDQICSAESFGEWLQVAWLTFRVSLRAIQRIASGSNYLDSGALHFDLSHRPDDLMKLVTQDVFNAIMVDRFASAATRRHNFDRTHVVISGPLAATSQVLLDQTLQRAGAITIDFVHGTMGNRLPFRHQVSSMRCVWTYADAESYGDTRPVVVAGMPRTIHPRPQAPGNHPTRVLFVTNYLQRDARIGDEFPRRAYLEELLLSIPELRRIYGDRFHFRWRPHPVDNEDAVREVLANYESVELSRGCPLSQDALWADIVISTVSSAAVELLLTGVPVFLHVMPTETNTPDVRFFAPERRFHRAGEFVNEFTRCVTLMDAGDPQATRPDREACTAFFGPAGEPGNILEWLERELSATTPG